MLPYLIHASEKAIPLTSLDKARLPEWLAEQSLEVASWVTANGFTGEAGQICPLPGPSGALCGFLVALDREDPWAVSALPGRLPAGVYGFTETLAPRAANQTALGWMLGTYGFNRYKAKPERVWPHLVWPAAADRAWVERTYETTVLVRDLINTPAADLGPLELAAAAKALAARHDAAVTLTVGEDLLTENYPAIHAVGRAASAARQPRLIDLCWGDPQAPRLTLVGKGVCFDSGGLDLKPSSSMKTMKKDMGGAAHALGLAAWVMAAQLPVRLRVLIPAVENAVSADAMRPLDVLSTRKGVTVEIGNTDAEGRLILCDALWEAVQEKPALLIDLATLTGAARTALGTDVPVFFSNDEALAADMTRVGLAEAEPVWRLPLHRPYRRLLDSKVADLNSAPDSPYAGAIIAALFLQEFVPNTIPWLHFDIMAWNTSARPGRPEGGEAMGLKALAALIVEKFTKT